jgi:hypothetical protein
MTINRAKLEEAIGWYGNVVNKSEEMITLLAAAAAYLATLPKTKMVEVWRVEFSRAGMAFCCQFDDLDTAEVNAESFRHQPHLSCIRVTGPHQQEVPA